jgi:hypothetical protein
MGAFLGEYTIKSKSAKPAGSLWRYRMERVVLAEKAREVLKDGLSRLPNS